MKAGVGGRCDFFFRETACVVLIAAEGSHGIGRALWWRVFVRALWQRILSDYDAADDAWLALGAAAPALGPVVSAKA
ncbi:MAG TPA: hypothetical protein VKB36_19935 [Vicinamibacterales bacterium]|nr:hypothetical protein [Vicinamibacterales bacterium]